MLFRSDEKIAEILALKRRMGFPDARMSRLTEPDASAPAANAELEQLVKQVMARLEERE